MTNLSTNMVDVIVEARQLGYSWSVIADALEKSRGISLTPPELARLVTSIRPEAR